MSNRFGEYNIQRTQLKISKWLEDIGQGHLWYQCLIQVVERHLVPRSMLDERVFKKLFEKFLGTSISNEYLKSF
jgi:hypothetical protein